MYLDPDALPKGWRAITLALDDAINKLIDKGTVKNFTVEELKEKYGQIRLYYDATTDSKEAYDELENVIDDYSYISSYTCASCGAFPVGQLKHGWILPICRKCYETNEQISYDKAVTKPDFYPVRTVKIWKGGSCQTIKYDVSEAMHKVKEYEEYLRGKIYV